MINMKRTHRIYIELGLKLRYKTPKRRVKAKLREDRCAASRVNDVWAMELRPAGVAFGSSMTSCYRPEDPGPDGRGHVLTLLAGARSTVQLSR